MVYKEHYIELFVNGKQLELENQKSLNLRFNNVLFDPTKVTSTQAEYSFEFEIPSTPNNDKIFDYANNLSRLNKFHKRWNAEVYADGSKIFEGSLTLNSYKDNIYKVNLVSVKNYSLDDIFGDTVMYDISGTREDQKWYIDFDGVSSINAYNGSGNTDVMFPLVCYGAFQKSPKFKDDVASDYTSKFRIDQYNKWWVESFYPSLNMVETMRKCFEYKGYTVGGDLFQDEFLKDIYMSVNLADEQSPEYNLGNPRFGKVQLNVTWTNPNDVTGSGFDFGQSYGTVQELKYPYYRTTQYDWDLLNGTTIPQQFNLDKIRVYDMMSSDDGGSVTVSTDTYMFDPGEHLIVIPADGFYRIEMNITSTLNTQSDITASQLVHEWNDNITAMTDDVHDEDITFHPNYRTTTPLEIQLVKNYDEDIELIKGKNNIMFHDGYPDNSTECNQGRRSNYSNWYTCFPHERLGVGTMNPTDIGIFNQWTIYEPYSYLGYVYKDNEIMAYDPIVNPKFIAGVTSMGNHNGGGCMSVIKNGYSWSKEHADRHDSFYTQNGYQDGSIDTNGGDDAGSNIIWSDSEHNKNTYPDCPSNYFSQIDGLVPKMNSRLYCMVYLKKNDILQLFAIHRDYKTTSGGSVSYSTTANVSLTIEAASPKSYAELIRDNYGYYSPIEFDDKLRLSNFLNKDKKVSEWVQNIADAFNLDILQNGNTVTINTKKKFDRELKYAVDIDNRVNSDEAESSMIDYPKSMAVKYKIDTDEWGAEKSVIDKYGEAKMNEADWKNCIDSGFTVIMLNDDSYVTSTSDKNLQFSYTWYDNFTWIPLTSDHVDTGDLGEELTLRMPVISKFEYMIDGYDYEESMKHDGYGLSQRFWFKPQETDAFLWTNSYPAEKVNVYLPVNVKNELNLSYKTTEKSLLSKYFNITSYLSSNYVKVDVYLTPKEYEAIKNGAMIHFDSDLYYPVEISGYDCSGYNPTTLKMMKKVV